MLRTISSNESTNFRLDDHHEFVLARLASIRKRKRKFFKCDGHFYRVLEWSQNFNGKLQNDEVVRRCEGIHIANWISAERTSSCTYHFLDRHRYFGEGGNVSVHQGMISWIFVNLQWSRNHQGLQDAYWWIFESITTRGVVKIQRGNVNLDAHNQ
jgi:hypothetical protein